MHAPQPRGLTVGAIAAGMLAAGLMRVRAVER
jgi:hypothetical protein